MHKIKFREFLFCTSLFFTLSQAYGDETQARISSLESRISAVKMETAKGTVGAQMASASPLFDGYGLFVTADLLFWHLYEGGSEYALSRSSSGSVPFPTISGKSSHICFDWDFGFRTGLGYHFEHDAWDSYANFTWFQTHASSVSKPELGETLVPQKGTLNSLTADRIEANWDVQMYVVDLELGRRFFVSKFLALRPQFGIESAWIYQNRHFTVDQPLSDGISGEILRGRCNSWGIGPRAGLEGAWYFGKHYGLFGNVNGSILWENFNTKDKEIETTPSGTTPVVKATDSFRRLVPNLQILLGISWDANIVHDLFHLGVKLGYEFQYWWRQNQFLNPLQSGIVGIKHESEDMSINGATLNILFDF